MKYTSACIYYSRSDSVALVLDDLHDLRDIFLAGIVVRGFDHHTDNRLGTGFTHQNTTSIAKCFCHSAHGFLHSWVILCCFLIRHTDILQHLRINLQRLSQLAHGHLLCKHDLHHLETGQDTITGACVLGEDDMTTLLTADTAAVLSHILVNIFVAHSSLSIADALLVKGLVQTKVGHDRGDHGIGQEFSTLLHVATVDVQDMVTGDDIPLLIHAQAAVSVAIEGKTDIQTVLHYELLQALNVGRTSIVIDIRAVRLVVDNISISSQSIEHRLCNVLAGAIGAVQANLDTLEGIDAQRDQITHITVAACHIVHSAADVLAVREGKLRPVLIKDIELAVDVVLHQQQSFLGHFLAVAVDQLDAVIVVGIMAGRDHDAAIEVIHTGDVGHRRRGSDVQQVGVCARSSQTGHQTILEHIRATAGILANDDAGRLIVAIALAQCIVVPAEEATHLVGMVNGQINTSFTTEAINSKIFFLFPKSELLALYALAGKSVACCSPRRGSIFEQHSHADAWPQS